MSGFGSTKATSDEEEKAFLARAINESLKSSSGERLADSHRESNPDYARQHASQVRLEEYIKLKKNRLAELNKILENVPEGSAEYMSALGELSILD